MTEVMLPEPVDEAVVNEAIQAEQNTLPPKKANNTIEVFIIIAAIAIIGLFIGLGYNYLHSRSQDNTRKQDLSYIAGLTNSFYSFNHFYPTLDQINSTAFSAFYPNGIDRQKFKDPSGTKDVLVAVPSTEAYAYQVSPAGCNNTTVMCTSYSLTAIMSNGKNYAVTSSPAHSSTGNK
ncbi:MAG TPA: hypothetical protein VIH90_07855 [Candidatus Saccharimonadales bacterium]